VAILVKTVRQLPGKTQKSKHRRTRNVKTAYSYYTKNGH